MRLLLSGFEAFGGEPVNPSELIVQAVAKDPPAGVQLSTLVLPVRPGAAAELLVPEISGGEFDAWLGLGQAGRRTRLSVERIGINVFRDRPGEPGSPREQPIVPGGAVGYFSRLPHGLLAARMAEAGAPTVVSNTAGTYHCNEVLYRVEHQQALSGTALASGFIHLPYLPEQAAQRSDDIPSMSLETQLTGVLAAIGLLAELFRAGLTEQESRRPLVASA